MHTKPRWDVRRPFVDLDECFLKDGERSQLAQLESESGGSVFAQEDNMGNLLIIAAGNHDAVLVFLRGAWGYATDLGTMPGAATRKSN